MKSFLLSVRSEYYKSRKTLAFWGAVVLPFVIIGLITLGFYVKSEKLAGYEGFLIWWQYASGIVNVMGILLMPMLVVFIAYSVNNIEHRADMWKSLFSLPLSKAGMYAGKYFFAVLLVGLCLSLFASLLLGGGNLLGMLKPEELKFHQYNFAREAWLLHLKLFLSGLGILSIQFLLSLIWTDFVKPMGIGFLGTVIGIVAGSAHWEYAYLIPYAHPFLALQSMKAHENGSIDFNLFSQEIYTGLFVAIITFAMGYFVVRKRSVK